MAKKIRSVLTIQLPAGKATPAPPVGTVLGPTGINIVEFCKSYNEKTAAQTGQIIPAQLTIYEDRSFSFILKTPPAADLLLSRSPGDRMVAVNQIAVNETRFVYTTEGGDRVRAQNEQVASSLDKVTAASGKATDAAAFQRLVTMAGGVKDVDAFCAKVGAPGKSGDRATGKPSDRPGRTKPDSSPTVPDAKPDTVPTASPSHPTGRP